MEEKEKEIRWFKRHPDDNPVIEAKYKQILNVMSDMTIQELRDLQLEYDSSYTGGNMSIGDFHTLRFCLDVIKGISVYPKWKKQAGKGNFKPIKVIPDE